MCGRLPRPAFALRASAKRGGARRDRTADLVIANDALSQLSYGPFRGRLIAENRRRTVGPFKSAARSSQESGAEMLRRKRRNRPFSRMIRFPVPLFAADGTDI